MDRAFGNVEMTHLKMAMSKLSSKILVNNMYSAM